VDQVSEPSGLVYFIASSDPPRCKIGYTAGDPNKRLAALQSGSPSKLGIYCAFKGSMETEKLFHKTFAPLRVHGEWFEVKYKLLDFLLCMMDAALTRHEASWNDVFDAAEIVILADAPFKETDDKDEYLASADTSPWEWFRQALAELDAQIAEADRLTETVQ
jgi:hypothetical protein